jgi:hypothetical protein
MNSKVWTLPVLCAATLIAVTGCGAGSSAVPAIQQFPKQSANLSMTWHNVAWAAIRQTNMSATVQGRVMAILHTCIYDAWAPYDATAVETQAGVVSRRPVAERTLANKNEAVSYAAYRALSDLFPTQTAMFKSQMQQLGYDPNDASTDTAAPDGIGNVACAADLAYYHNDGSNQLGGYADTTGYTPPNPDPDTIVDPSGWQPQWAPNGQPQTALTPQWANVRPFALSSPSEFRPTTAPARYGSAQYARQAADAISMSAGLTDEQKVIAEYWEDGPAHICFFAEYISQRDHHTLDDDVKMMFALTQAMNDATIATWDAKFAYNSERPYTAVHALYSGKTIQAWGGPGKGTVAMDGSQWRSYLVTPSFPEHTAGHGAFGAAAAEIFRLYTGSDTLGASWSMPAGGSSIEPGVTPHQAVTLTWATFTDAALQCGQSRIYGGVHFQPAIDLSEALGRKVADTVWARAQSLFVGQTSAETHNRRS